MSHWAEIRARARKQHQILLAGVHGTPSAEALLTAAALQTDIHPYLVPAGDPLLGSAQAVLDRKAQSIFYDQETDPSLVSLLIAHEYAHLWLGHGDCTRCSAEQIDPEASDEDVPLGVARVQGYSPEERREREANVYARELLLPGDVVRGWYLEDGMGAAEIATRMGLPEGLVFHQLTHALLTPEPTLTPGAAERRPLPELDPSQRDAAFEPAGPVLVEAGPGTGKTRTLVARVGYLVGPERREDAASILALTFSIKAAEEMRERVAGAEPDAAVRMQIGTFHSFGLNVLRKLGHHFGYPPRPRVLDPAGALFLLERMLPELGLVHYQNLYEPTANLRDLLDAISRAKDELCTPAEYERLARQMLAAAGDDDDKIEDAERALEVARVYRLYQERLDAQQTLDFGDLIFRAVELVQRVPAVRAALASEFRHVLVDEYQDVNRASGVLLEELAGACGEQGLWVVGDARQSIYRWRGASPANFKLLRDRFPRAKVMALRVNYRSRKEVVDLVSAFAPMMQVSAGIPFAPWTANRGAGGKVRIEIAEDTPCEILNIAREIERRRDEEGLAYAHQAVLCRSHTQLARVAAGLELVGVPVLYLGDLFERTEVRDLLALLSLACQGDGRGLLRVTRFPEYSVPLADVLRIRAAASEQSVPFPRALELAGDLDGLSVRGRAGLQLLAGHVDDLCYGTNAWGMLVQYLFNRSGYVRLLARDLSVAAQQQRLALYQFLEFAHQNRRSPDADAPGDPKRVFLDYVRRLEVFGEEKQLRNLPESAAAIDAVRLLTVHGSKGLEFPVVHLPGLGRGYFPAKRQGVRCPPPTGMVVGAEAGGHEEEEECLFFVAISRARDELCLSRAQRHGKTNSNPSPLLTALQRHLPRAPDGPVTWRADEAAVTRQDLAPPAELRAYEERDLDTYMRCPRQYLYERVIGLRGRRDDAIYVEVHKCVYGVIRWIQGERAEGRAPDIAAALARLAETWSSTGPVGHPYEGMYRHAAEAMVGEAMDRIADGMPVERPEWEVPLKYGRVRFTPDHVAAPAPGAAPVVYRLRTGRLGSRELEEPIYGLYHRAFSEAYPGRPVDVHVLSLSTRDRQAVTLKSGPVETRIGKYDEAIAGILRGDFPPNPDDRKCPRCPHYFICPLAEEV
jgi:superfamily I DNA/RNA helicase